MRRFEAICLPVMVCNGQKNRSLGDSRSYSLVSLQENQYGACMPTAD